MRYPALVSVVMFAAASPLGAGAGLREQGEFESRLRREAVEALRELDSRGYVKVKVDWNRVSAALPGTSSRVQGWVPVGPGGEVSSESVRKVSFEVFTSLSPVPAWLEEELRSSLALSEVPVTFRIKELPAERSALLDRREAASRAPASTKSGPQDGPTGQWALFGALAALASLLSAAVLAAGHRLARERGREQARTLEKALEGGSTPRASAPAAADLPLVASRPFGTEGVPRADASFRELGTEILVALFADFYWSALDGEAHHVWSSLAAAQKSSVLERWSEAGLDERYFSHIRRVAPVPNDAHQDAAYLDPIAIGHLDNAALTAWVKSDSSALPRLSAIRARALGLTLAERLEIAREAPGGQGPSRAPVPPPPAARSQARRLPPSIEIPRLSEADESFLFENPASVPDGLRGAMPSLVWLALSPAPVRAAALARHDARALAQAWIGPEAVLEVLAGDIPKDKRELLQAYRRSVAPDRGSSAFQALCRAAEPDLHQRAA